MKELLFFVLLLFQRNSADSIAEETVGKVSTDLTDCVLWKDDNCLNRKLKKKIPSRPVFVNVTIGIVQITDIDDVKSTVEMSAWITMQWYDDSIEIHDTETSSFDVQNGWQDKIWYPDTTIRKLIDLKMFEVNQPVTSKNIFEVMGKSAQSNEAV